VIVITHVSADAVGIAAIPSIATVTAAVTTPTTSFRLLNTVVFLLPPLRRASRFRRARMAAFGGRYWLTPAFATVNCLLGTCRVDARLKSPRLHGV
jgi:hypothetical protein